MPDRSTLAGLFGDLLTRTTFPPPGQPLRCGVSGGADSLALLALAVAAGCEVTAVHVDHGQRPGSAREAELVVECAQAVGAAVETTRIEVAAGPNLEARLRAARYDVLGPQAATGHTLDDQAATVLINLVRGAGLVGLGAMQPGPRRPLLGLRRAETEAVCTRLGWTPFVDPSNTDSAFVRNRIRHELRPLLDDIAGRDVAPLIARSSNHLRAAADLVDDLADEVDVTDARAVAALPEPVAARAIQRWIRRELGEEHPIDAAGLARVRAVAAGDIQATEVTGGIRVRRSHQRLIAERIDPADELG